MKANDLLLLKPGIRHKGKSVTLPFQFLCIHFDLFVPEISSTALNERSFFYDSIRVKPVKYNKAVIDFPELVTVQDSSYVNVLLRKIIYESTEKHTGFNIIVKSLFIEFIINIFRQENEKIKEPIKDKEIRYPSEVQAIIEYITIYYMNSIQLADLAQYVHLHPTYISSLFKKYTGYNIFEFLKKQRLMAAKKMLLETDRKIDDIAYSVGFSDLHYFSKVFKAYEGLAPSQYRHGRKQKL